MKTIILFERTGRYAENKDIARDLRLHEIIPALRGGEKMTIDFAHVDTTTQSFVHALISDVLRRFGVDVLDRLFFKSCNATVRAMIGIVVNYTQEGMGIETDQ